MKIVTFPHPALTRVASRVELIDEAAVVRAKEMAELLHKVKGQGLAAPQVGWDARAVVVRIPTGYVLAFNPVITRRRGTQVGEEACLSLPGEAYRVRRARRVVVEFTDHAGVAAAWKLSGTPAVVWQHEVDHLDGILINRRGKAA